MVIDTKKSNFWSQWLRFHLVHFDIYYKIRRIFLENATDIIVKCDSYFITKHGKKFIIKFGRPFYYKRPQLLHNAVFITKRGRTNISIFFWSFKHLLKK